MSILKSPCHHCGQVISESLLRRKNKLKGQRVSAALKTARELGENVGRPRKVSYEEIKAKFFAGRTRKYIKDLYGCSYRTIARALNSHNGTQRKDET